MDKIGPQPGGTQIYQKYIRDVQGTYKTQLGYILETPTWTPSFFIFFIIVLYLVYSMLYHVIANIRNVDGCSFNLNRDFINSK